MSVYSYVRMKWGKFWMLMALMVSVSSATSRLKAANDIDIARPKYVPEDTYGDGGGSNDEYSHGGYDGYSDDISSGAPVPTTRTTKLCIRNLPCTPSRENIISLFSEYGRVEDAFIPFNREASCPCGFGFLTMELSAAMAAIKGLNNTDYFGLTIYVDEAAPASKGYAGSKGEDAGYDDLYSDDNAKYDDLYDDGYGYYQDADMDYYDYYGYYPNDSYGYDYNYEEVEPGDCLIDPKTSYPILPENIVTCDIQITVKQGGSIAADIDGIYKLESCYNNKPLYRRKNSPPGQERTLWYSSNFGDWDVSKGSVPNEADILMYGGEMDHASAPVFVTSWHIWDPPQHGNLNYFMASHADVTCADSKTPKDDPYPLTHELSGLTPEEMEAKYQQIYGQKKEKEKEKSTQARGHVH